MEILIESATLDDFNEINLLFKEGHDEHSLALPNIFRQVDQVMPDEYFHSLLTNPSSEILIARLANEVVGFAVVEVKEAPLFDSLTPRKFAYINDFGVASKHNRKGIGKRIFQACLDWAKSHEATTLELNVWEFNHGAISFYESLGMETVSRKMSVRVVE
ncbi:MAG: GNAT family N-acetyltransferase [Psychrobacillus psychrodurans]